jgi:hypothetical protein
MEEEDKHRENSSPTADIKDYFVLKEMLILNHSIHIGLSADLIFLLSLAETTLQEREHSSLLVRTNISSCIPSAC